MPTTQPPQDPSSAESPKHNDARSGSSKPSPGMEGLTAGSGFGGDAGSGARKGAAVKNESQDAETGGTPPSGGAGAVAIVRRELIILGIALLCGFLLVPLAIWAVGNRILGPYTHLQDPTAGTGPMRLLADYYDGLVHGWVVFWWVGFGPYVLVWLVRLIWGVLRRPSSTASA